MKNEIIANAKGVIDWLWKQVGTDKLYRISEVKSKRSLTQNAYYWLLINQLADRLRKSKDEVHFDMLKSYGQSTAITLRSDVPVSKYFSYYDKVKDGQIDGKSFTAYKVYAPSHTLDSKEFSVLLDGLISECEQQGIPTMTPTEIERMARG